MDLMMLVQPNIGRDPTRESLIRLHQLIVENAVSVALNLKGGRNVHLALTISAEDYMAPTGYAFLSLHNPGDFPQMIGTSQEQEIITERFRQNQALFGRCTTVGGAIKKHIVTEVQPVFLSPLVDQFRGLGQVTALQIL